MNIIIHEVDGKNIHLPLPSGLILNRLTAGYLSAMLRDKHLEISGKQLDTLFHAIRMYSQNHPEWKLVEVYGRDGKTTKITI